MTNQRATDFASGEVVSTPDAPMPFCAIFRVHDDILFRWPVHSIEEGEVRISAALAFLRSQIDRQRAAAAPVIH